MASDPHDPRAKARGEIRLLVVRHAKPVRELRLRRRTLWRAGTLLAGGLWATPIVALVLLLGEARMQRDLLAGDVQDLTRRTASLSTEIAALEKYAGIEGTDVPEGGPAGAPPSVPVATEETRGWLDALSGRLDATRSALRTRMRRLAGTPSGTPVPTRMTSRFGWRDNPFTGRGAEWHSGLDFGAPMGTPVKATAAGTVQWAETRGGYGLAVAIRHEDGYVTLYGHLRDATVKRGQQVERGDVVGHVGNGGRSTGPHVHYEVRRNGAATDPRRVRPAALPTTAAEP